MADGDEPVETGELLYRRIPVSTNWYDPNTKELSPEAFGPHKDQDRTGLSIFRNKYTSLEDAARGRSAKGYYVAVLRASDLQLNKIAIVPRPSSDHRGHAELPALNSESRKEDATLELQRILKRLTVSVEGPFYTPPEPT